MNILTPSTRLKDAVSCKRSIVHEASSARKLFNYRVVQKLKFLNKFSLKTAKCRAFCETCETTNRVVSQVHYKTGQFIWFIIGNTIYYIIGITLALIFKKGARFVKYGVRFHSQ
jgi:hypothetical protein